MPAHTQPGSEGSCFRPRRGASHASGTTEPTSGIHHPGDRLGDFRLISVIGSGGMGEVWEAEETALSRHVALKLILPSRAQPRDLEFFAREARAGGRLSHPGIVRVYGYGESDGVHWINQELVAEGWTLRDSIDQMRKTETLPDDYYERAAELVIQVAEALQSAHDAGVIHRDVKPQNILIDSEDKPKVSDFGLARITDESALTQTGDFAGTYLYMSPEQVAARRMGIDHRSDIFSLGVVLYELLSLQRPFEGDTAHQIAEKILTWDPPDLRKLRSRLPMDLAVITGKALEKRPLDRYPSMTEFAADIRRFLANEPIQAKPPGPLRRTQKWVLRNPTKSTAAGIGMISLVIITGLLLRYMDKSDELAATLTTLEGKTEEVEQRTIEVEAEKVKVEEERDRLAKVVDFQEGLFDSLVPDSFGARLRVGTHDDLVATLQGRGRTEEEIAKADERLQEAIAPVNFTNLGVDALVQEILTQARKRALEQFGDDPITRATLQSSIAQAYQRLGVYEPALELREESLRVRREVLGGDHLDTLSSVNSMGVLLESMGELERALPYYQEDLETGRRLLGDEHPDTLVSLNNMGFLLHSMGQLEEALPFFEQALEARRRVLGEDHPDTLDSLNDMGAMLESMGLLEDAMPYYEQALAKRRETLGHDHEDTLTSLSNMGSLLASMGKLEQAMPYYQEALDKGRLLRGDDHPETLVNVSNMGYVLHVLGRLEEAMPYYAEALEKSRRILGDDHPDTLVSVNNMGSLLWSMNKLDQAMPYYEEALSKARLILGPSHHNTLITVSNMGRLLESMGKLGEAMTYHEEALESRQRTLGDDHPATLTSVAYLGMLLVKSSRLQEGRDLLEPALERARTALVYTDDARWILTEGLIRCYEALHAKTPEQGFDVRAAKLRAEWDRHR